MSARLPVCLSSVTKAERPWLCLWLCVRECALPCLNASFTPPRACLPSLHPSIPHHTHIGAPGPDGDHGGGRHRHGPQEDRGAAQQLEPHAAGARQDGLPRLRRLRLPRHPRHVCMYGRFLRVPPPIRRPSVMRGRMDGWTDGWVDGCVRAGGVHPFIRSSSPSPPPTPHHPLHLPHPRLYNPTKIAAFSRECYDRGLAVVVVCFPATPLITGRTRICVSAGE